MGSSPMRPMSNLIPSSSQVQDTGFSFRRHGFESRWDQFLLEAVLSWCAVGPSRAVLVAVGRPVVAGWLQPGRETLVWLSETRIGMPSGRTGRTSVFRLVRTRSSLRRTRSRCRTAAGVHQATLWRPEQARAVHHRLRSWRRTQIELTRHMRVGASSGTSASPERVTSERSASGIQQTAPRPDPPPVDCRRSRRQAAGRSL